MRHVYFWDDKQKKFVERVKPTLRPTRPYVITDEMPPTSHPCNGKFYTSKAKFRNETRAHGCVEVGTENTRKYLGRPESINVEQITLDAWNEIQSKK